MTEPTSANDVVTPDPAAQALNELVEAGIQTDAILRELDDKPTPGDSGATAPVTEAETERLRVRARRQRERGLRDIARRYEGIASMLIPITLNERVVGSAFERFFSVIENGIYVMTKHGEMFLGVKAHEQLLGTVSEKIKAMLANADTELAATKIQLEVHATMPNFIQPTYIAPAANHTVQVRTRLAADLCQVFSKLDQVMTNLQALAWNGEVELSQIDDQEYRIKRDIRDMAKFTSRTIRGMRSKVATKSEAAPDPAAAEEATA